jgi:large subunit ribosomal protein L33
MLFPFTLRVQNALKEATMAKKGKVRIITLECTEARKEGKPPSRYTTAKNTQTHPERLEKKKYNPNLRRHTVHRELK